MFLVMQVQKDMGVSVNHCDPELSQNVKVSWADGMIGACPVFGTFKEAQDYVDGKDIQIVEIEPANPSS